MFRDKKRGYEASFAVLACVLFMVNNTDLAKDTLNI